MFSVGQLDRPADINGIVQPASLPDPDSPPLADFAQCTVSGWGVTWLYSYELSPVLKSVNVDIFNNCQYYYYFRVTDNMICAGSLSGGRDSCQVSHEVVITVMIRCPFKAAFTRELSPKIFLRLPPDWRAYYSQNVWQKSNFFFWRC